MNENEGVIERNLHYWKSNLIDISKKNRMINFKRDKKKVVSLKEGILSEVEKWIDKGYWLNIEQNIADYDVLQSKDYEELDKLLTKLRRSRNSAMLEKGVNTLYFTVGLLEWETDDKLLSPILMIPIELKQQPTEMKPFEQTIILNPCLAVKIKKELGIEVPEFKSTEKMVDYLENLKGLFSEHKNFKINKEAFISLYDFSNIAIFRELEAHGDKIKQHPITRNIASNHQIYTSEELGELSKDDENERDTYQVLDADSSQSKAIMAARKGMSFVVQGPPGTGKSQTISNIISDCLGQGKTVLFVSEKMAALDVVYKRLKQVGLDDFCLELHSNKANKKEVITELHRQLHKDFHAKILSDEDYFTYEDLKSDLNEYTQAIHRPYGPLNKTPYWFHGKLAQLDHIPLLELNQVNIGKIDTKTFMALLRYSEQLESIRGEFDSFKTTHWNELKGNKDIDIDKVIKGSEHWHQSLQTILHIKTACEQQFKIKIENFSQLEWLIKTALEIAPNYKLMLEWNNYSTQELIETCKTEEKIQNSMLALKKKVETSYKLTDFLDTNIGNLEELMANVTQLNTQLSKEIYSKVSSARWLELLRSTLDKIEDVQKLWNEVYIGKMPTPQMNYQNIKETYNLLSLLKDYQRVPQDWLSLQNEQIQEFKNSLEIDEDKHKKWNETQQYYLKYFNVESLANRKTSKEFDLKDPNAKYYFSHRQELISDLEHIQKNLTQLMDLKSLVNKEVQTLESAKQVMDLINAVEEINFFPLKWIDDSTYKMAKRNIEKYKMLTLELITMRNEILEEFEAGIFTLDIETVFNRFNGEYLTFIGKAKQQYRNDLKVIQLHAKNKAKMPYEKAHHVVSLLKQYQDKTAVIEALTQEDKGVFNYLCDGITTNFEKIEANFKAADAILKQIHHMGLSTTEAKQLLQDKSSIEKANRFKNNLDHVMNTWEKHQKLLMLTDLNKEDLGQLERFVHEKIVKTKAWLAKNQEILQFDLSKGTLDFSLYSLLMAKRDLLLESMTEEDAFRSVYGLDYKGISTDWTLLKEKFKWLFKTRNSAHLLGLQIADVLNVSLTSPQKREELVSNIRMLKKTCSFFNENTQKINMLCHAEISTRDELSLIKGKLMPTEAFLKEWIRVLDCLRKYRATDFTSTHQVSKDLELINEYLKIVKRNKEAAADLDARFGTFYEGTFTNWNEIIKNVEFFQQFTEQSSALKLEISNVFYDVVEKISTIDFKQYTQEIANMDINLQHYHRLFKNANIEKETDFATLEVYFKELNEQTQSIPGLRYYLQQKQSFDQFGYEELFHKLIRETHSEHTLVEYAEKSLNMRLLTYIYEQSDILNRYNPDTYELTIKQFKELDKQIPTLNADKLINKLNDDRKAKLENFDLLKDKAVIDRENNKLNRHLPIRQLFTQTSELVMNLKPCLLMSPVTVSEFLDIEKFHFDLVVFDEASQICPEDVISTMLRGDSVIIAGDSQQLPPTKFFKESYSTDEEEFEYEENQGEHESILDLCTMLMPQKTLRWHYRSKSESLITFSNENFYKNFLYSFPNPFNNKNLGIELNYVPDGVYDRNGTRSNLKEAEKVVELAIHHFENHPERSLGIITFSHAQMDLIQHKIEDMRQQYPQYDPYLDKVEESFFVKNLENAQGDERDTIILSIGYGKDNNGVLRHQFGPLSNEGGERRLNVAITRAKLQLHVVSSIHSSEIDLNRSKSLGVQLLKEYLLFTENLKENGQEAIPASPGFESPLEQDIIHELTKLGYEAQTNIGYSDYRMSIGIFNPQNKNEFILGIECDGPMFANTNSARDRNRIRHEILENMGWNILHISSQSWFTNKKQMLQKIQSLLPELTPSKKDEVN